MTLDPFHAQILAAKASIHAAELALQAAVTSIDSAPRSAKVTIDRGVEEAFERLRAAAEVLASLEALRIADDDEA
jgi:hypothetical protein